MIDMMFKVDCLIVWFVIMFEDVIVVQWLCYCVFVQELGGDGVMVDYDVGIEVDRFDFYCDYLLLIDLVWFEGDIVVGVYCLLCSDQVVVVGGFYIENEYDLMLLK